MLTENDLIYKPLNGSQLSTARGDNYTCCHLTFVSRLPLFKYLKTLKSFKYSFQIVPILTLWNSVAQAHQSSRCRPIANLSERPGNQKPKGLKTQKQKWTTVILSELGRQKFSQKGKKFSYTLAILTPSHLASPMIQIPIDHESLNKSI